MKLSNPRKFRKACKVLENYLDHSLCIEHYDEWRGEVEVAREYLDPQDWRSFDAKVAVLEAMGLALYRMWEAYTTKETKYRSQLDDVFEEIWEATKRK